MGTSFLRTFVPLSPRAAGLSTNDITFKTTVRNLYWLFPNHDSLQLMNTTLLSFFLYLYRIITSPLEDLFEPGILIFEEFQVVFSASSCVGSPIIHYLFFQIRPIMLKTAQNICTFFVF